MYRIENHGTLMLVRPLVDNVTEWLDQHTDGQWFGGALVVEPRYVEALVEGMREEGFVDDNWEPSDTEMFGAGCE